jgi:kynurenine 3-monooxygenase
MQRAKYFDYSQRYLDQSYKEIVIPANTTLSPQLANDAFHVWPRGQFMLSGFPKIDGSFSLSLQLPRSGDITFDKLATLDDYRNFFSQHFPDALSFADPYLHSYVSKPEGSLLTVKCAPWSTGGRVGLIGDACHGILPFLGQGANAGFEDCLALLASLEDNQHNWQQAFVDYENRRRPNTDLIADWSYENFQTLQKHIADPAFALRKQLELRFVHLFPDMDSPSRYYNIAFTRKPYQEIQNIDRRYAELFTHILSTDGIEKKLMSDSADTLILRAAKAYGFTDSK